MGKAQSHSVFDAVLSDGSLVRIDSCSVTDWRVAQLTGKLGGSMNDDSRLVGAMDGRVMGCAVLCCAVLVVYPCSDVAVLMQWCSAG